MVDAPRRKLIEVALPLEAINRESAREKSIRQGHPFALHLWWSRKPLATARAVLFAQLVDDPSSFPQQFRTEEEQRTERERLHGIVERLVVWENLGDAELLNEAHREIVRSAGPRVPSIVDPFAGGGTIPLEAQRLGVPVHASDLNPVAVLINKALTEIPQRFSDRPPVFPGAVESRSVGDWHGYEGLASDVRAYGKWMRSAAEKQNGQHYPDVNGAVPVAWLWARSVTCPNPACRIDMPLTSKWWLSKKLGREAYVIPSIVHDRVAASGHSVRYEIGHDKLNAPTVENDGTVNRAGATCIACSTAVDFKYIRSEGKHRRMGFHLMATVLEGKRERLYVAPSDDQIEAALLPRPESAPDALIPDQALSFRVQAYGLNRWSDLFTNRQATALASLTGLVPEVRERVLKDAVRSGMDVGDRLEMAGLGAASYADAIATYLGLAAASVADDLSTLVAWRPSHGTGATRSTFARQALPMTWDFAEANPFARASGDIESAYHGIANSLERLTVLPSIANVGQGDARAALVQGAVLSTDPPYYDSIGYSDLSDYFYVWLRPALQSIHPSLFSTLLVPKKDELVANPYRHNGKAGAKQYFEDGFKEFFSRARVYANADFPATVFYAFKQSEVQSDAGGLSGWETILEAIVQSGWTITSTWPIRSERGGRMNNIEANSLASSIVLSLRPRPADARTIDRRGMIAALQSELPEALRKLQQGMISPVDLPQASIGPGMAVFSRYTEVIESDGSRMSVRSALARINETLDQVLTEQEGEFDAVTRFAVAWYRQHGYSTGQFGDADNLARARATSVDFLARNAILTSRAGKVTLLRPEDTPVDYDVIADQYTSAWEVLHHAVRLVGTDGVVAAGQFLATAQTRGDVDNDLVKELAFLLFSIAEKNGWTQDALAFNTLASSWAEVLDASRAAPPTPSDPMLAFGEED